VVREPPVLIALLLDPACGQFATFHGTRKGPFLTMKRETTAPRKRRASDPLRQAQRLLQASSYTEIRRLSCEADGKVLRLAGHVSRFHLKQIAQHLVLGLRGFDSVENLITVTAKYRDAS
jgi:hypothetical protein